MSSPPARHSVSVAAVVVDDQGRVLMTQRRDNGRWEPPGGVLELAEPIDEGLKREVLEETGFRIEPIRLTGVYKNMTRGVVALVFLARVVGGESRTTTETSRVEWWTPETIGQQVKEAYAVRILDALAPSEHASVRMHDGHHLLHGATA
jgi:ADP-ribose pyrophosphatase